jgi:CheY-like chemotaxis protein
MIKKILFAEDDRILRLLVQKKLDKYKNTFIVLTAENGLDAVQKLKENTISLVVTDLQMPQMDGFALLAHLSEKYADIPVIIQTGYSTPKSKKYVLERGVSGYIEKPFKVEQLAKKIIATLKKESEGGMLQTIPLEMFVQLIEMEQKTCTIRVVEKTSGELGVLFFRDGNLMEARIGGRHGKQAAYEIFSWDEVTLAIQDDCAIKAKKIEGDLQAILFDAMRLKDEVGEDQEAFSENLDEDLDFEESEPDFHDPQPETLSLEDIVRRKLESVLGERKYLKDIYPDNAWHDLVIQAAEIGKLLEAGTLKSCYINQGEPNDFILVPGEQIVVVTVDPRCPRDRMLRALK